MAKVFMTDIPHEIGVRALLSEGKMQKFKMNGEYIGEFPIDLNLQTTLQEIEMLSILESNGILEIAIATNNTFEKRDTTLPIMEINNRATRINGLLFMGFKDIKLDNTNYKQYLYGYLKNNISLNHFN